MRDIVLKTLTDYKMLRKGDCVTVGLSGGADSVCLTHILYTLQKELSLTLQAVHVHHGIRGESADYDEQFCRAFCETLCIPLTVVHVHVPQICKETHESHEECGRRLRYEALGNAAGAHGKIATAHTADDNAETVLLNLTRGTGLAGLCGIPPVRGNIIRPLLFAARAQVEQYCAEHELRYVTDETNFSSEYSRNRIRAEVLPVLKALNPSVLRGISGMSNRLRSENEALSAAADKLSETLGSKERLPAAVLCDVPKAVACRVLQTELNRRVGKMCTAVHIESVYALLFKNGSVDLPAGVTVRRRGEYLEFICGEAIPPWEQPLSFSDIPTDIQTPAGVCKIQRYMRKDLQNLHKDLLANAVDCAKIRGNLELRSRRGGDRFSFGSRGISKSLKKWMNETKIPPEQRNSIPVLSNENGEVLWVGTLGTSSAFLPDENTNEFLLLTLSCGGNTNA